MLLGLGRLQVLYLADPEIVSDLLNAKTALKDKHRFVRDLFVDLLGDSFLFAKADQAWKAKRKAVSPGFYKDKLRDIFQVMKDKTNERVLAWTDSIQKNGPLRLVLSTEIKHIYASIMFVTLFGEDISLTPVELVRDDGSVYELPLHESLSVIGKPILSLARNPIRLCTGYFDTWRMGATEKRIRKNCQTIRALVRQKVKDRRAGRRRDDIMQLLIDDDTIFNTNDELIVDQILDLIMAGASTVQLTSLGMLHHISRLPEVRTRV